MTLTNPATHYKQIGDGNAPISGIPSDVITLSDDLTLDGTYPNFLRIDPGGANRVVTLDAETDASSVRYTSRSGLIRIIANAADADETIDVQNDAAASLVILEQYQAALLGLDENGVWSVRVVFQGMDADTEGLKVRGTLWVDVIAELTAATGVTIDSLLIKDGGAQLDASATNINDNADPTKQIAFDASGITTGTERTVTMPDADVDLGDLAKIATGFATVPTGAATVNTGDLGLGDLSSKRVVCSLGQAAEDATAIRFWGVGQADGSININSNANATANTDVYYMVDAR